MKKIEKAAIVGRGAIGVTFGSVLHEALKKDNFCFIVDENRKERYEKEGLICNGKETDFRYESSADTFGQADLILICTKFSGLEQAIEQIKPFVGKNTLILSGINGIKSEDILRKVFDDDQILRAIAQKMDALYAGNTVDFSSYGELVFGYENEVQHEKADHLKDFFDSIDFPYNYSKDIVKDAWNKLMLNCGLNQICAVYDKTYGTILDDERMKSLFVQAMKEVQAVAQCQGIDLTDENIEEWIEAVKALGYNSMPSMAQDVKAKRKTEKELFAGTIMEYAAKMNISVPIMKDLYQKIEEIEKTF